MVSRDGRARPKGRRPLVTVATLVVATLVAAACGDDGGASDVTTTTTNEARQVAGIDLSGLDLPDSDAYGEYGPITDDTETLEVEVPVAWDDLEGFEVDLDDETVPWLDAAPDLEAYAETFDVPGSTFYASTDPDRSVEDFEFEESFDESCAGDTEEGTYDDGLYVGDWRLWTDCGDADAALLSIIAGEGDVVVVVTVQMVTDPDVDAAVRYVETYQYVGDAEDDEAPEEAVTGPPRSCLDALDAAEAAIDVRLESVDLVTAAVTAYRTGDQAGFERAIDEIQALDDDFDSTARRANDLADTCTADYAAVVADDPTGEGPEACLAANDAGARFNNTLNSIPVVAARAVAADRAGDEAAVNAAIGEVADLRRQALAHEEEYEAEAEACRAWPDGQ